MDIDVPTGELLEINVSTAVNVNLSEIARQRYVRDVRLMLDFHHMAEQAFELVLIHAAAAVAIELLEYASDALNVQQAETKCAREAAVLPFTLIANDNLFCKSILHGPNEEFLETDNAAILAVKLFPLLLEQVCRQCLLLGQTAHVPHDRLELIRREQAVPVVVQPCEDVVLLLDCLNRQEELLCHPDTHVKLANSPVPSLAAMGQLLCITHVCGIGVHLLDVWRRCPTSLDLWSRVDRPVRTAPKLHKQCRVCAHASVGHLVTAPAIDTDAAAAAASWLGAWAPR
mmetsp:Transcript_37450/g.98779  ORF Transcript_37450/g.98779 Transcript_37450/m.98779 type:complete len:286 (+) Transcript_37450:201-1058(+)